MGKFNFFKPWTWLGDKKKVETKVTGYSSYSGYSSTPLPATPYKNIYYTGTSIVVVFHDGSTIMKNGVSVQLFQSIEQCNTRQQIESLLTVIPKEEVKKIIVETPEERKVVTDNLAILRTNEDFVVNGDNQVSLVHAKLEIPAVVVGSFIELLERIEKIQQGIDTTETWAETKVGEAFEEIAELTEQYEALKMFWYWTAMNPIDSARRDVFNFIRKNEINLTSNGLLMMYRRIVPVVGTSKSSTELVEFISSSYLKVKKWKKSPKSYEVFDDNPYVLVDTYKQNHGYNKHVGNLADLYANLHTLQDKTYTDNHTKTKDIKIGAIYREDENKIDLDNTKDCSRGLHVGSKSFGFGGYGETGVLALVNPMYVRSVPVSETNKMRVSEMFIAGEMSVEEYGKDIETQAVADFSSEYCSSTLDVLRQAVKDKSYDSIRCQGHSAPLGITADIPGILSHIEQRVYEIV